MYYLDFVDNYKVNFELVDFVYYNYYRNVFIIAYLLCNT